MPGCVSETDALVAGMEDSTCSYSPSYLSVEDILATQERLPVEVNCCSHILQSSLCALQVLDNLDDLGFLDPGSDNRQLQRGTK